MLEIETEQELVAILKEIKSRAKKDNKKTGFFLSTTSKKNAKSIVVLPLRETKSIVLGGVTVYNFKDSKKVVDLISSKIDYLFIDAESKISGLEKMAFKISKRVKKPIVHVFKNNDITVESLFYLIFNMIKNLEQKTISIIGTGNIATKISLKLIECELNVRMGERNFERSKKVTNAINLIKTKKSSKKIIPRVLDTIALKSDILIGLSAGCPVINDKMIGQMNKNGIIIDGGIGTVFPSAIEKAMKKGIKIVRLDVRNGFLGAVNVSILTEEFLKNDFGKGKIKNQKIISGGIYGQEGDIVVNSISNPLSVIGISNGKGGIMNKTKLSKEYEKKLNIVKKSLNRN